MREPNDELNWQESYYVNQNSYYFITVCTHGRRRLLADAGIPDLGVSKIIPNSTGQAVTDIWAKLRQLCPCIISDSFCLMPNHIHGIIIIKNQLSAADSPARALRSLHDAISSFKAETTQIYNLGATQDYKSRLWQTSFYYEDISGESALNSIRKRINENPLKWSEDEYF